MEIEQHKLHKGTKSGGEAFSFPSTPSTLDQDSDFEFECVTPNTPTLKTSPADHLFFNGRLLPHSFPPPPQHQQKGNVVLINYDQLHNYTTISRSTSITSSVSSKDSFMSSRSNSTNSSRSSVSSARTSSSCESRTYNNSNKLLYHVGNKINANASARKAPMASKVVMAQLYGSSQRWQHIVPVMGGSVLKRDGSRRASNYNGGFLVPGGLMLCKKNKSDFGDNQVNNKKKLGFLQRLFRSFLVACKQCHAMEYLSSDES